MISWTPERDEWLMRHVKDGFTTAQIADLAAQEFDYYVTRNMVSGRIWRLRRKLRDDTMRAGLSVGRIWHPPGSGTKKYKSGWESWKARKLGLVPKAIVKPAPPTNLTIKRPKLTEVVVNEQHIVCCGDPVEIWDLDGTVCRYPIWPEGTAFSDQRYCGNALAEASVYCAAHHAIARTPSRHQFSGNSSKGKQWGSAA